MLFTIAKYIHLITISLSITGFIIRVFLFIKRTAVPEQSLVQKTEVHKRTAKQKFLQKKLPQYIDIILLASAIIMLWQWQINPFYTPWLTEKLFFLCVYILLGMVALHWGKTLKIKFIASIFAIFCFIYIVFVALTKTTVLF